ncbi:hypothetical protein AYO44_10425 [Planctomycetaceae bacterium SCGC AG-212-F19]|nr:hypothetical protein AYO44_10425 [Planctomycetaceae bacterium SCGC AG-212-F19]
MGTAFRPTPLYWRVLAILAALGSAALLLCLCVLPTTHWFDLHDVRIYHDQSRWVVGEGTLYRDVPSEYPLLANLLFGKCRLGAALLSPLIAEPTAYAWLWLTAAWFVFLAVGHLIATRVRPRAVWAWLAPGALFFALFRYDIYPAATTLLALLALRDDKMLRGACWLGVTVALKGYALFLVPAFLVFMLQTAGGLQALRAGIVAAAPFTCANLAVLLVAGWDGMLFPFRFHAQRFNFGESSYDAFYYLGAFLFEEHPTVGGRLPFLLQAGCAILAAAMRPRTFDELIDSFLVALLGFMSFSVFYSPQYILWILPIACFSSSILLHRIAVAYGWLTFLYFPIFHVAGSKSVTLALSVAHGGVVRVVLFRACVILVTFCRFAMIAVAVRDWWTGRRQSAEPYRVEFSRCQEVPGDFRMSTERREHHPTCP